MFEFEKVRSADIPPHWCALLIAPLAAAASAVTQTQASQPDAAASGDTAQLPAQDRRADINERIVRGNTVLSTRQPFVAKAREKYSRIAQQYGDRVHQGRCDVQPERDATTPIPE